MADSESPKGKTSDLGIRLLSAVILGPLVLGVAYLGGAAYAILVLVAACLFFDEWIKITGTPKRSIGAVVGFTALAALALLIFVDLAPVGLLVLVALALGAFAFERFTRQARWCVEGLLYSGLALYALTVIRDGTIGLVLTFFLLIVVWATDIFAYFSGRAIGGPKLWARVSPKKTWSGALGGLAAAMLLGTGFAYLAGSQTLALWALLALVLSAVSQAGDLLESAIKRRFDVKDSSQLIPGHGGIMDRVDGLVAAAICAAALGLVAGGSLADPMVGLGLQ
ncbi:phosphatidate cytidylyltransferase [Rhodobacterales bacterium]|nr:phosphatidate cytidylyltransferase [Rhodobacterales bacterium]